MARNRKRAKERRTRRGNGTPPTPPTPRSRQGVPTATHDPSRVQPEDHAALDRQENGAAEREDNGVLDREDNEALEREDDTILERQDDGDLASELGGISEVEDYDPADPLRQAAPDVELADAQLEFGRPEEPEPGDEADEEEYELEVEESIEDEDDEADYDEEVPVRGRRRATPVAGTAVAERREPPGTRLIGFLQGSWRELQRVQWPDRRQVMQATGVVIGFVIVAAAFLGLADLVAGKLVSFVLK